MRNANRLVQDLNSGHQGYFLFFFFDNNCYIMSIGFTLLYFKMAVIPLVPETKMVDIGKLISLENLLVRKVTWFVLTTTSTSLILSHTFEADHTTRIAYIYSHLPRTHSLHFHLWKQQILSLSIFTYRDSTLSLYLSLSLTHIHTHILTTRDSTLSSSF